ncbi:MAG TPA: cupin domain-containing protein [Kofleriaceae bacterium]|nr:cupin domain-containing protein [Kofleriaceae bacterium]
MNRHAELARTLLDPIGDAAFFAERWCQKPAYCRGTPDRFAALFGLADLPGALLGDMGPRAASPRGGPATRQELLQTGARRPPIALKAYYNTASGRGSEILDVPLNQAMALYDAGLTLCVSGLERNSESLAAFVAAVRERMRFSGNVLVNAYYSPDGQGFNWHYDSQHVFILQIEGEKRWQFSDQVALGDPPFNLPLEVMQQPGAAEALAQLGLRLKLPSEIPGEIPGEISTLEEVLAPGDVLYLPPGTWHRAFARGRSFALSLTLVPLSFSDVLRTVLAFIGLQRDRWRKELNQGVPLGAGGPPEQVPEQIQELLRECLADAQDAIGRLSPEELLATWAQIRQTPMVALALKEITSRG